MTKRLKVYLAGQSNQHDNNWKEPFKAIPGCDFHDWEFDSDQTSPDTFFPDDLRGVKNADILVANPGIAPSEATWIEVGFFYAQKVDRLGNKCDGLIIVWPEGRNPKWSIEFVKKAGLVVSSVEEAQQALKALIKPV